MAQGSPGYRDLLRIADLPQLLAATTLARLASSMFSLAIILHALQTYASPVLAGWLGFAAIAPGLLVSPLAGALLDRVGPVGAIAWDLASSAALVMLLGVSGSFGWETPPLLLALVASYSLTNPLGRAGIRTLLPRMVPGPALDRVNGLDTAIYAATDVVGPGAAGLLVAFLGSSRALMAIACLFACGAFAVSRVRALGSGATAGVSLLAATWKGLRLVARQPTLRTLALSYSLYQVSWGILVVVVPVFALRAYSAGAGSKVAGLMWAASGIAGGVGALVAGHLRTTGRERAVMTSGMLVTALASWPIASEFGFAGLVVGLALVGAAAGPIDVGLLTLRQRRTEPEQMGRVLSISMSLNVVGYPLGSALAGVVIAHSPAAVFLLAAAASLLGALLVQAIPADDHSGGVVG